ncbi:MAG: murein biosynthesis integral membrane protein MurJ [Actinobacteria bacterium]|nr:murein biosynthesis integral membrane protein MurJ [Actinomycetota bacterium]
MSDHKRKLALAAIVVASATAVSRVTGLGREVITAAVYGVVPDYNTFVSVSVVPNLIRQLFADAAISAAFVPVLTALLTAGDRERARRLTATLLGFMLAVVGSVCVVLILAANPLVRAIYPELTGTSHMATLAAQYLQILVPTVLVLALAGVMTGVLYADERFTMPAVVSIVWNLVIIAFMLVWHDAWGVYALAWGTLAGTVVELILLGLAMRAAGEPIRVNFHFRDPYLRRVLALMVPITITLGILNFNALIDTYFAQFVSDHAAAEIGYSFRLYQLPQGIFAVTIGTVLFPSLSRYAAQRDMGRFRETLSTGVRQMVFVSLPFLAWFTILAVPVIRMVYQRGAFTAANTSEVAGALAMFAIGLTFANVNIMFNRSFQSMQRPWLPLYVGLVNLALNALLDWVLLGPLGVAGITLSTSLVSIFNMVLLVWLLRRQIGLIGGRGMARAAGAAVLCALPLAAVSGGVWYALRGFAEGGFLRLLVSVFLAVAAGGLVYLGIAKALKLEELNMVWRLLRRRRAEPVAPAD